MQTSYLQNKRILLVEDEPEIRDILKGFLQGMGISSFHEANDGYEALKFIDQNPHWADMVICDWNMPGMSGFSVFRQFRTSHPKMPFIMVTSRNDRDSIIAAKENGVENYLVKPLSAGELEKKVIAAFNKSALQSYKMLH